MVPYGEARHARACPGHPRLDLTQARKTRMAGHRRAEATPSFGRLCPAMTKSMMQTVRSKMSLFAKISTALDERSARLAGIGLMLLSVSMFSFGDALGKFMVATYAVGQLLGLGGGAGLVGLAPSIWRHRAAFLQMERPWLQLVRVILSTLEVAAFFLATVYLPLVDVITYYLACPIFVTALSAI